ncbi:hypothetical protein CBS147337_10042 [Penicillium roqueforti]|nr:hypothetical protein CBS147337_10042 [Penicillium roqueforti]
MVLSQAQVEALEDELFTYRQRQFKLAARVHLSHLTFEDGFRERMNDRQNVRRLERIMEIQGCQRLMKDCHVPVLVPAADWGRRVRQRPGDDLIPSLDVDFDYRLRAQDHENLIAAARKILGPTSQWWIVDVYLTEQDESRDGRTMQEKLVRALKERFPNDNRPPDGLIYERIRHYEGLPDGVSNRMAANNWWAALETVPRSKKRKYLRLFLKHPTLPQKLDSLLIITGLWEDMRIGLLHKVVAMRCDEPIGCYWDFILSTFLRLVGGRHELLPLINGVTVHLLQSRAPKVSQRDLKFLEKQMTSGKLFCGIPDEQRLEIWEQLKEIDFPIPTLATFFRDRLYLEVGQTVMRQLFTPDPDRRTTIDEGVCAQYDTAVPMSMAHRQEMLKSDLWELWRFSFQYGFEMTEHRRRVPRTKAATQQPSHPTFSQRPPALDQTALWQCYYGIARARGFKVPFEEELPTDPYHLPLPAPCDFPEESSEEIQTAQRCGKPFSDSVKADRYALAAESLQQEWTTPRVTAGFVRRSVFLAFFRYLTENGDGRPYAGNTDDMDGGASGREETGGMNMDSSSEAASVMPGNTADVALPPPSRQMFDPDLILRAAPVADFQAAYFMMDISLPGNRQTLRLPNDPAALNPFLEGLSSHHFHIYILEENGENGRSIEPSACYAHYIRNPSARLHAEFTAADSFVTYHSSTTEQRSRKRMRMDFTPQLSEAERWLEQEVPRLSSFHVPQEMNIF